MSKIAQGLLSLATLPRGCRGSLVNHLLAEISLAIISSSLAPPKV